MVSRFPLGSPIKLDGETPEEGVLIATFNQDVTGEDLAGKLKAVAFNDGSTEVGTAVSNPLSSPYIQFPTLGSVGLGIRGNEIYAFWEDDMSIFDIDFDGQHRKVFDQPNGIWLMMMPNMLLGCPSDRYAIIETANENNLLSVYIWCNEGDTTTGYQPITADSELQDIDVADWFNDSQGESNIENIASLITEVLKMEYHYDGTIQVEKDPEQQTPNVDGQWNPFTDGSPYTPLVMTSRLNNGQPVEVSQGRQLIATFNRSFTAYELVGKIKMAFGVESEGIALILDSVTVLSDTTASVADAIAIDNVGLIIEGKKLYVENNGGDDGFIFDVDYDEQHKRALTIQASPTPLLYYLESPTLIPGNLGRVCIYAYNDDVPYFEVVITVDDLVAVYTGQMPPQGVQANQQYLVDILNQILAIEFTNFSDLDVDVHTIEQDTTTMIAGVNLLEVTTMPSA